VLLAIDGTFVVQLINFVVFFLIVNALFMAPLRGAIAERRAQLSGLQTDIDAALEQAAALARQAEAKRAAARREAGALLVKARVQTDTEAGEIAARYAADAAERVARARVAVADEIARARGREEQLVRELADDLLRRAIDVKVVA
jgi:F-type H+-transporting ATPase subunit b